MTFQLSNFVIYFGPSLFSYPVVRSCADLYKSGVRQDGVYTIDPDAGVAPGFLRRRGYGPRRGGLSTLIVRPTRKFWYCIVVTLIFLA